MAGPRYRQHAGKRFAEPRSRVAVRPMSRIDQQSARAFPVLAQPASKDCVVKLVNFRRVFRGSEPEGGGCEHKRLGAWLFRLLGCRVGSLTPFSLAHQFKERWSKAFP